MKIFLKRFSVLLIALGVGVLIFLLLLFAGDKGKGPLEDLMYRINTGIARLEKKMITDVKTSRTAALDWFDRYRNNTVLLNAPDTLFLGVYEDNTAKSYATIVALEDSLETKFPVIQIYTAWGSRREQRFPMLRAQAIYDLGSIPMITWEPWLNDFDPEEYPAVAGLEDKNENGLQKIAAGEFDRYIDEWAMRAKEFRHPFFLRFGHEMNDPYRYPWGPQNNEPQDYIAAWQHVYSRFKAAGADNVIWIWSPHIAYEKYHQFYPGHNYVDWIGATTLNYGAVAPWSRWWPFKDIFQKGYDDLSHYGKPLMITEFGSLDVGGNRAKWYKEALVAIPLEYPAVKSVVFFHASDDNTTTYKTLDWSILTDEATLDSVKAALETWK